MLSMKYLLAGKARFIIRNEKGYRYIFLIKKVGENEKSLYFVHLQKPDEGYMGVYNPTYNIIYVTPRSKFSKDSKPFEVFEFAMAVVLGN